MYPYMYIHLWLKKELYCRVYSYLDTFLCMDGLWFIWSYMVFVDITQMRH